MSRVEHPTPVRTGGSFAQRVLLRADPGDGGDDCNALEGVQAQHFWRQNRALSGSLLKVNALSADEVVEEANGLCRHWNDMTRDERRRIAESVIEKPVIGDGEIDITPSHLSGSEELTKSQQRLRGTG